jgi:hypothetical protein
MLSESSWRIRSEGCNMGPGESTMSSISECTQRVVGVGYPDFWQRAHDQFPKFFGTASLELVDIGNTVFRGSLSEPLHKVARHLARMVFNSIASVSVLVLNGSGVDAMKIARGMFETSVTLGYLRLHPEQVEDYLDYHCVIQKQRSDFMKEHEPDRLKQLPAELLQRIETDFARVAPRFQNRKGKLRSSWSKVSIREMTKDVGKEVPVSRVLPVRVFDSSRRRWGSFCPNSTIDRG